MIHTLSIHLRLIWKEYRTLAMFWLALAAIAVGLQAVAVRMHEWTWRPLSPIEAAGIVASVVAAIYAAGCGAALFASLTSPYADSIPPPKP